MEAAIVGACDPSVLVSAESTTARSCSLTTGRSGPLFSRTDASLLIPTIKMSPKDWLLRQRQATEQTQKIERARRQFEATNVVTPLVELRAEARSHDPVFRKKIHALVQSKKPDPQLLVEARGYLQAAMEVRKDWSALAVLAGKICEMQDDPDQALDFYMRAVYHMGERDSDVISHVDRFQASRITAYPTSDL